MNKTRFKGLVLLILGAVSTAGIVGFANLMSGGGNWNFIGYGFAIPGAIALVGLIQLVGGVPFRELALKWDSLAGWQRGILGTIFVIAACGVMFGGLMLFATIMYD